MIVRKDITTGEEKSYNTKVEAAKELNINESSVRKAIKKGRLVMGKYKFINTNAQVNIQDSVQVKPVAKILILDIETAPLRSYTWGLWKQNVGLSQIISNWYMISWAAKWLHDDAIASMVLDSKEAIGENDYRIVKGLWDMLDAADIVVAHNCINFDIPKTNTRFLINGLNPPSPYRQIDTLNVARQQFGFSSNRLDHLAKLFGFDGKEKTDFSLWAECMAGDEEALEYMEFYNIKDVIELEKVYLKLRPYIKGHPNLDLYSDNKEMTCPMCGSKYLIPEEDKYFYTQAVKYSVFRCNECGGLSRSKQGVKFENKKLVSAIPR